MPHTNRVTPFGTIEADAARGLLMGNRGILHDAAGRLGTARWRTRSWIACRLAFNGRQRRVLMPGTWTELFFLDEAVALAAGHRPCAECRRADFLAFAAAWRQAHCGGAGSRPLAPEMDAALHAARLEPGTRRQQRTPAALAELPDGVLLALPAEPDGAWLWSSRGLRRWSHGGYGPPVDAAPSQPVLMLTPEPTAAVLRAGYRPLLHPSAA